MCIHSFIHSSVCVYKCVCIYIYTHIHWLSMPGNFLLNASISYRNDRGYGWFFNSSRENLLYYLANSTWIDYLSPVKNWRVFARLLIWWCNPLVQQSSTFLAPGTSFVKDSFTIDRGMVQAAMWVMGSNRWMDKWLACPPLTFCCVAWFLTGCGRVQVCSPGVGDFCSRCSKCEHVMFTRILLHDKYWVSVSLSPVLWVCQKVE